MGFVPSPVTEDLASFLQGLPPGAHVAINLGGLDMETAMQISRKVADTRKERLVLIGHGGPDEKPAAPYLGRALPLNRLAPGDQPTWVVVEAAASVEAGGAREHARAEHAVGVEVPEKLTVVCFYSEAAMQQVTSGKVHGLHSVVAAPGSV